MTCLFCEVGAPHTFHDGGEINLAYAYEGTEPPSQRSSHNETCTNAGCFSPEHGDARALPESKRREGDPRFLALLDDIEALHAAKQADYGRDADPFANVRASEEWGVSPWVGALIRATDKVRRLQTFATKGTLRNEGVEDSLMDLAVYALISLILFREEQA